jgi:hypothetical protein
MAQGSCSGKPRWPKRFDVGSADRTATAARRQAPSPRAASPATTSGRHEGLRRQVERRHRERRAEPEQHGQRLRVVPGVELGGGGDVALGPGAGHQDDLRDAVGQRRLGREGQRQVRHRPEPDHRDGTRRRGAQLGADGVRRDARRQRRPFGQRDAADAVLAMHRRLGAEFCQQGAFGARHHRHRATGEPNDGAGVRGGARQPDIAAGDRHQPDVEFRRGQRQPQRDGVVGAGIAVDDAGLGRHASSVSTSVHQNAAPWVSAASLKSKCGL